MTLLTRDDAIVAARGALKDHIAQIVTRYLTEAAGSPSLIADEKEHLREGLQDIKDADTVVCKLIDEVFPGSPV